MVFKNKMFNFMCNYASAFFVGCTETEKIVYANKKAKELFFDSQDNCNLEKIFNKSINEIKENVGFILDNGRNSLIYNTEVTKSNGQKIIVDIQIGYFDDDNSELFLEIIPQNDTRMQMAINQIDQSSRPKAILNLNESLSIVHCNEAFHLVFDSNQELRYSHFDNDLVNGFLPEKREELIKDIVETLKIQETYSTKIKVFSATGEEYWYLFELERRTLDNSGTDKVMAYMTNIEKQVELEEKVEFNKDFFKSVYNLIDGVWYSIDVKTKTLYHMLTNEGVFDKENAEETKIPDYINFLISENVIHPDDQEIYRKSAENFLKGINDECTVRFSFYNYEYNWYTVKGHHIYDDNGELTQIIGILLNVNHEQQIKAEHHLLNQYLNSLQELTDNVLYTVDVKDLVLTHTLNTPVGKKIGRVIPNYRKVLIDEKIIHPDDSKTYLDFLEKWYNGTSYVDECTVRASLINENEYQLYIIRGKKIYDKEGTFTGVIGALINIQEQHEIEEENSRLNQYFSVFQELTNDILYRVEMPSKTLYHSSPDAFGEKHGTIIKDHVDKFINEKIIHPEDAGKYMKQLREFISEKGQQNEIPIRVSVFGNEYQWYKFVGKKIIDTKNNIVEVVGAMINIDEKHKIKEEYSLLNQYLSVIQQTTTDILYRVDVETKTLYHFIDNANDFEKVIPNYVQTFMERNTVHPDDKELYLKSLYEFNNGESPTTPIRFSLAEADYKWYRVVGKRIYDNKGKLKEVFGALVDVDNEYKIQENYSLLNQYFESLQELTADKIFHIDLISKILRYTNSIGENISVSIENENFIDKFIESNVLSKDSEQDYKEVFRHLITGEKTEFQLQISLDCKTFNWFNVKSKLIKNEKGQLKEIFGKIKNIDRLIKLEDRALRDSLTKVLNKETFEELVNDELKKATIEINHALVFIDVDDFKFVNDTYGHQFGDFVLEKFAQRINNCIRDTDIIGRVGGDEFVVYLKGVFGPEMALDRANTMIERMMKPISNSEFSHKLGLSIGIAMVPADGITFETLYRHADKAVYKSKNSGKNIATFYSSDME